jgi:putative hemolysin
MSRTWIDIGLVLVFILIGGSFALAEMALVSLRESQARGLESRGRRGQAVARLTSNPTRFLAAAQVGVTCAGFLSAAFGGATLADQLAPRLEDLGLSKGSADAAALVLITLVISYASLVLAELSPKRIALQRSEAVSLAVAPTIERIAKLFRPIIWLLSVSTNLVVRLVGGDPAATREQIGEAELRELLTESGALGEEEKQIVQEIFAVSDRQIREVMVPRTEVDFIPGSTPVFKASAQALEQPHSRYPVIGDSSDDILGFVHIRDLLKPDLANRSVRVRDLAREALLLPMTRGLLSALSDMRRDGMHLAVVVDEYGGTAGIVTMEDLVEELVGDIRDEYDTAVANSVRSLTGEIEVDGLLNLDDFEDETGMVLPEGPYETVGGYLMQQLGRIPIIGDCVSYEGNALLVSELDGHRVSRVTVKPEGRAPTSTDPSESDSDMDRFRAGGGPGPGGAQNAVVDPVDAAATENA